MKITRILLVPRHTNTYYTGMLCIPSCEWLVSWLVWPTLIALTRRRCRASLYNEILIGRTKFLMTRICIELPYYTPLREQATFSSRTRCSEPCVLEMHASSARPMEISKLLQSGSFVSIRKIGKFKVVFRHEGETGYPYVLPVWRKNYK